MRVLNKKHWPVNIRVLDTEPSNPYGYLIQGIYADDRVTWCTDNLPKGQWYAYAEHGWKTFAFKEKEDLTAFKLRWK